MSKFFNETQRAQDWSTKQTNKKFDLPQVLEAIRGPLAGLVDEAEHANGNGVSPAIGGAALSLCPKIRLPQQSDTPVLFPRNDFMEAAVESYRALRTRILRLQAQKGLRSIVISSAVPGEGKTSTTANLALCCAQLNDMPVMVIDGDLRTRGLTTLLGKVPSPGLGEILSGQASFEEAVRATDMGNLYVLGAGSSNTPPPALYSGDRWKELIGKSAEHFKLIIVDSPPIVPLADFEQISAACDAVLAVVRTHHARKDILKKASGTIDPSKLIGVVLNASITDRKEFRYNYYGYDAKTGKP
jgi:protein-tyrosine kinase